MTFTEVQKILYNLRYKPNFTFEIIQFSNGLRPHLEHLQMIELVIKMMVCERDTGAIIPIIRTERLRKCDLEILGEKGLVNMIFDILKMMEFHEASEQFLYKGVRIFDPHNEERIRAI